MATFLVTGASGFLASNLLEKLDSDAVGISTSIEDRSIMRVDLDDSFSSLQETFNLIKPKVVFHLAAVSSLGSCEQNPEGSYKANVLFSERLAELCKQSGAKLVFTSSAQVFDGESGWYKESDSPGPINAYGQQKWMAEQAIYSIMDDYCIVRVPLMFGYASGSSGSFLRGMLSQIKDRKPLKLFIDEWRTPLGAKAAIQGLIWAKDQEGVYHLACKERLSRVEIGQAVTDMLGYGSDLIVPLKQAEHNTGSRRPSDVSLNTDLARSLGWDCDSFKHQLQQELRRYGLKVA